MKLIAFLFSVAACMQPLSAAIYSVETNASSGPNQFGSPSYAGWVENGIDAMRTGAATIGDPSTSPTAWFTFSNNEHIFAGYGIATAENTWIGQNNPTGAFMAELGNRIKFSTRIVNLDPSGGNQFNLDDVEAFSFVDDGGTRGTNGMWEAFTSEVAGTYSFSRVGIDYGVDRIAGTADDVILTSGSGTGADGMIDELVYIGLGFAYDGSVAAGGLAPVFQFVADNGPIEHRGGFRIADSDTAGGFTESLVSVHLTAVPEPSSLLLIGLGGLGLFVRKRNNLH